MRNKTFKMRGRGSMKKLLDKIVAFFLAGILMVAIIPVAQMKAAGSITLSISPSAPTVSVGDEIRFTVSMSSAEGTNFGGFSFRISVPEGIQFKAGSGSIAPGFRAATGFGAAYFDEDAYNDPDSSLLVSGGLPDTNYNGGPLDICSFTCIVTESGNKTVTLIKARLVTDMAALIENSIVPAVVTAKQQITSVDITLERPVTGAAPQMIVSGKGYTGIVEWSNNPEVFNPNEVYVATITLTTNEYYLFSGETFTPTVNTNLNGTVILKTATQLVFSVIFPVTAAKTDISETISFSGDSFLYNGMPIIVSATTTDSSDGEFTYSYIGINGTEYLESTNAPSNAGTYAVTAYYESGTATGSKTISVTIAPQTLAISGVSAVDRDYDGTTTVYLIGGMLSGVLEGDVNDVVFNLGSGAIQDANAGTGKAVTTVITLTGLKSGNYKLTQPISITVNINKVKPTVTDFDFFLPSQITYDGTLHAASVSVRGGLIGFGTIIAIKYNGSETAPINSGTYEVTAVVSVGINYEGAIVTLGSFTIDRRVLSNAMLTITGGPYVYNGSAQTPTYSVADGTLLIPDDYTVITLPHEISAGSYDLIIMGQRNYSGTAVQSFVIAKTIPSIENLTITVPPASDYDGQSRRASVTAGSGLSGLGTVTLLYNGIETEPVDVGKYIVTADIAEGQNYTHITGLSIGTIVITRDNLDIAAAKVIVENTIYSAAQANVVTIAQAKSTVQAIIGELDMNGVLAVVNDGVFRPAVAGTEDNPIGTNGSYTFTVTLSKGAGIPQTTITLTLNVIATLYNNTHDGQDISFDSRIVITARKTMTSNNPVFDLSAKEAVSGYMFVAAYDTNGRLTNTTVRSFSLAAGESTTVESFIPYVEGLLYKFFIWDSNYIPLTAITSADDL